MELTNEKIIEFFQVMTTQNQQIIDILMMVLKNKNEDDADLVDYIHNQRNLFLADLSPAEFGQIVREYHERESSS